jgi:hypothetical protein
MFISESGQLQVGGICTRRKAVNVCVCVCVQPAFLAVSSQVEAREACTVNACVSV